MTAPQPLSTGGRAARALAWGYGGTVARMVVQIGAQAVLARLLGPQEFGVFAALTLLAAVAVLAADLVSAPLIQAKTVDVPLLRLACASQGTGAVLVALVVLAALPAYQWLFPQAQGLALSVSLIALGSFATGLGGVALSLLRRELRYREIQLAQLAGYLVGYVGLAIPLALAGLHSHLVLVLAWTTQAVLSAALQYAWERHPLAASFAHPERRRLLGYGGHVALGNVANWVSGSIDRVLITRFAPAIQIGYYNTMLNLVFTPVHQLSASLNTVAFSLSAQASEAGRRTGAVVFLNLSALLFAVLYGVFAAFPQQWVGLLYGPRWLDAAGLLPPLCLAAVGYGLGAAANAVLTSTGEAAGASAVQVLCVLLIAAAVWVLVQRSVVWAAWSVASVYMLRALLLSLLSLWRVGLPGAMLLRVVLVPLALAAAQLVAARQIAAELGPVLPDRPLLCASVGALAATLALLPLLWALRRVLLADQTCDWLARLVLTFQTRFARTSP